MKNIFITALGSLLITAGLVSASSLTDWGNDPAYPTGMYFVGVAASPHSQTDADNLAVGQIQKQITVNVRVNQESHTKSMRVGSKEDISRWLDSRTTLTSHGQLQGAEIVKRGTRNKNFTSLAVLKKSQFAATKRLAMREAAQALQTVVQGALKDAEAGNIADALAAKARIDELVRTYTDERLLLSAAEALTDADQLPVNLDEVNKAFNQVLKSITVEVVSGANQNLTSPGQALEPWVVAISADGKPLKEFPLKITGPDRKVVRNAITNDQGRGVFFPDAFAFRAAGEHNYRITPDLQVSRSQVDIIERKRADFSYKITPVECGVQISIRGTNAVQAAMPLTTVLGNYGLRNNPNAKNTLKVNISAETKGMSQGLSEASTFTMQEVTLDIQVLNAAGTSIYGTQAKAVGHGNASEAVLRAINKIEFGPKATEISRTACGDGSPTKPAPTLAILPFSAPRNWYGDRAQASLLADMIAGSIHRMESYQIVERTKLTEIMDEQALGATGVIADPVEMGQILGAQFMMTGTMIGEGTNTKVEARIIEVSTGKVVRTFSITGRMEAIANHIGKQTL